MSNDEAKNTGAGPLAGLTVVDFTRALAGPYATLILGALGARVIKIEEPGRGDGRFNAPFLGPDGARLDRRDADDISFNSLFRTRNKQAITLNLKHPEAKEVIRALYAKADIVVENFTAGTLDRLGFGYEAARQINPALIYCAISGFGAGDGRKGERAMDGVIQALSGVMMTSGNEGDPPVRLGVPIADLGAPLFGVIGILSALAHRERTGEGQFIDVSMLGTITSLVAFEPFGVLESLGIPIRTGPTVPRLVPFGVYPTSDGHVVICSSGDVNFNKLAQAFGDEALANDPNYATQVDRLRNHEALDAAVTAWTSARSTAEVTETLARHGVASAPVRAPDEAIRDPRVLARGETVPVEHPKFGDVGDYVAPGLPISFSRTPATFRSGVSPLGGDNEAILEEFLGWSAEDLARKREDKLI